MNELPDYRNLTPDMLEDIGKTANELHYNVCPPENTYITARIIDRATGEIVAYVDCENGDPIVSF